MDHFYESSASDHKRHENKYHNEDDTMDGEEKEMDSIDYYIDDTPSMVTITPTSSPTQSSKSLVSSSSFLYISSPIEGAKRLLSIPFTDLSLSTTTIDIMNPFRERAGMRPIKVCYKDKDC